MRDGWWCSPSSFFLACQLQLDFDRVCRECDDLWQVVVVQCSAVRREATAGRGRRDIFEYILQLY